MRSMVEWPHRRTLSSPVGAPRAPDTPSPGRPTRRGSRTGRPGLPRERRAGTGGPTLVLSPLDWEGGREAVEALRRICPMLVPQPWM